MGETTGETSLRGDLQWFGISGAFAPSAEQVHSTRHYLGLEPEGTYFWGTLRDNEGGVYIFMRRMPFGDHVEPPPGNASIGRRAILFYYPPGMRDFTVHPASMATGYNTQQTTAIFTGRDYEATKTIMDVVPVEANATTAFGTAVELGRQAADAEGAGYPPNLGYAQMDKAVTRLTP